VTDLINNTRMAPTPSGYLHVGNIMSFAITSALAQKNNAKVLLRIDNLDQVRANEQYVQDIFDTLNYLEIPWDTGPGDIQDFRDNWSQVHRMQLYHAALGHLCDKGLVFACTCSRQQIKNLQPCTCLEKHIPLDTENAVAEVACDFCGAQYHFDAVDVGEIFVPVHEQPPGSSAIN